MNTLIILAAKYFIVISCIIAAWAVWRAAAPKRFEFLARFVGAGALSLILAKIAGALYYDPRPFFSQHIVPLIPHAADNGFPSDHTLLAAWIGFSIFIINRRLGILALGVAILVGLSRIAAHVHSPIDIIGSFVISCLAVLIVFNLPWPKKSASDTPESK